MHSLLAVHMHTASNAANLTAMYSGMMSWNETQQSITLTNMIGVVESHIEYPLTTRYTVIDRYDIEWLHHLTELNATLVWYRIWICHNYMVR